MSERTYKLKKQKSLFKNYIVNNSKLKILPLTHKKDWFTAKETLRKKQIKTQMCDVFKEKIEYLFYGRPAYYVSNNIKSRMDSVYFPVCFILKPDKIKMGAVFPFDTGAFANKMYDDYIHEQMDINDFQLSPDIVFINNFISFYYENNDNYYKGKHQKLIRNNNLPDEINAYQNLINNNGATSYDSRCRTVEIITRDNIDLNLSLEAVILPFDMTRTDEWKKFIKINRNIKVITYYTFGDEPGSYNSVIRDKMYAYLCDNNYI